MNLYTVLAPKSNTCRNHEKVPYFGGCCSMEEIHTSSKRGIDFNCRCLEVSEWEGARKNYLKRYIHV